MTQISDNFIFGTYKLREPELNIAISTAFELGIRHFDTAQLYCNERKVVDALSSMISSQFSITTKVIRGNTPEKFKKEVSKSIKITNASVILAHHPVPIELWNVLEKTGRQIGVSNYQPEHLYELLKSSDTVPVTNQVEFHPFIDIEPILSLCNKYNIPVQGHTVLAQAKHFNTPTLITLSQKYNKTVPQIMIKWALQHNIQVCISSPVPSQIKELVNVYDFTLDNWDMDQITKLKEHNIRFY